ncbi:hypothetical protein D3C74_456160 [compost metagenome]
MADRHLNFIDTHSPFGYRLLLIQGNMYIIVIAAAHLHRPAGSGQQLRIDQPGCFQHLHIVGYRRYRQLQRLGDFNYV